MVAVGRLILLVYKVLSPVMMCVILVRVRGLLRYEIGLWLGRWGFYVIVLVFLGGIIVSLLYVAALSPSTKVTIRWKSGGICIFALPFAKIAAVTQIEDDPLLRGLFTEILLSTPGDTIYFISLIALLATLLGATKIRSRVKGSFKETLRC